MNSKVFDVIELGYVQDVSFNHDFSDTEYRWKLFTEKDEDVKILLAHRGRNSHRVVLNKEARCIFIIYLPEFDSKAGEAVYKAINRLAYFWEVPVEKPLRKSFEVASERADSFDPNETLSPEVKKKLIDKVYETEINRIWWNNPPWFTTTANPSVRSNSVPPFMPSHLSVTMDSEDIKMPHPKEVVAMYQRAIINDFKNIKALPEYDEPVIEKAEEVKPPEKVKLPDVDVDSDIITELTKLVDAAIKMESPRLADRYLVLLKLADKAINSSRIVTASHWWRMYPLFWRKGVTCGSCGERWTTIGKGVEIRCIRCNAINILY